MCFFLLKITHINAQSGIIQGRVFDAINNEPIPFANVIIQNTNLGTTSLDDGTFVINNLDNGLYNLQVTYIGYTPVTLFEVEVSNLKPTQINVALQSNSTKLQTVEVKTNSFNKIDESPISLQTIGVNEIKRSPGSNRDISKVIQSFPGVASTPTFRNDILIRGGSPSENKFYIDGIEIPTINHFQTQGASGGPVGIINVDFVREVNFYAGAFPANRGNTLSSVFDFKFIDGLNNNENTSRNWFNTFALGSSDAGIITQGNIKNNTNIIASARVSYLQFLFKALNLPFLPNYVDYQFKVKHTFNSKNNLSILGIGAIDKVSLNNSLYTPANLKTAKDSTLYERNTYILDGIPPSGQKSYTIGLKYTHFEKNNYSNVVVSRSELLNTAEKFIRNNSNNRKIFDYSSKEVANNLNIENVLRVNNFKLLTGINTAWIHYDNLTYREIALQDSIYATNYFTDLNFFKYALFTELSTSLQDQKLQLTAGLRVDANTYSAIMRKPFNQLSPRLSISYLVSPKLTFSGNAGIYYQTPSYLTMGFKDNNNNYVNKQNNLSYIKCNHFVAGVTYFSNKNSKISLEGFYKKYSQYPFSLKDSISLANLGGDFGTVGDEAVSSTSKGRTYGVELLAQQKLFKGFFGIIAYTFSYSEFENKNNYFTPSSWDNRHIVSLIAGKKMKKNWEIGAKWRFSSGAPYTPINIEYSSKKVIWDVVAKGLPNYNLLNTQRIKPYHSLDVRVDKKWFLKKIGINLYLDVQNIYAGKVINPPILVAIRDENGLPITDVNNPLSYKTKLINDESATVLPSIGLIISF